MVKDDLNIIEDFQVDKGDFRKVIEGMQEKLSNTKLPDSMLQRMFSKGFFDLMDGLKDSFKQIEDPLIIHDPENKSPVLSSALDAMK